MLNVAVLMGRLTADPELRTTPNGVSVTSFTIACDRSYVASGAERQADFIDIVAWRKTAEFICKYFRKGQLIAVQGAIQTRTYTDKSGNKRKAFEIVADNAHFAESKRDSSAGGSAPAAKPESAPAHTEQQQPVAYASGDTNDFQEIPSDDDLPF
jgi:single-strand DNA-binding protein